MVVCTLGKSKTNGPSPSNPMANAARTVRTAKKTKTGKMPKLPAAVRGAAGESASLAVQDEGRRSGNSSTM